MKKNFNGIIDIYLTNLADYNNGVVNGCWVCLPIDELELKEIKNTISNGGRDELFITDYECILDNFDIDEYDNIYYLNNLAYEIIDCDDYQLIGIDAYLWNGENIVDALEHCDDIMIFHDCYSMKDVAYSYIEQTDYFNCLCIEKTAADIIERYFDYESFGRDLDIDGTFIYMGMGTYVELLY